MAKYFFLIKPVLYLIFLHLASYFIIHVLTLPSLNPCVYADHVSCVRVTAVTLHLLAWCLHSESTLHRYEVHPYRTLPAGPGPEFKTTLRVRSCRGLGILRCVKKH